MMKRRMPPSATALSEAAYHSVDIDLVSEIVLWLVREAVTKEPWEAIALVRS